MDINVLRLLDEMDKFRRTHQNEKEAPPDYCMRVMEAILAEAAGYKSRIDWTEALKADVESMYHKEYQDIVNYRLF